MTRRFLLPLLLTCALSGCGTLADLFGDRRTKRQDDGISSSTLVHGGRVRVYGGVRYDLEVLYEAKAGWLLALYFLDVPLSVAVDTVLLPFTVPYNLAK